MTLLGQVESATERVGVGRGWERPPEGASCHKSLSLGRSITRAISKAMGPGAVGNQSEGGGRQGGVVRAGK